MRNLSVLLAFLFLASSLSSPVLAEKISSARGGFTVEAVPGWKVDTNDSDGVQLIPTSDADASILFSHIEGGEKLGKAERKKVMDGTVASMERDGTRMTLKKEKRIRFAGKAGYRYDFTALMEGSKQGKGYLLFVEGQKSTILVVFVCENKNYSKIKAQADKILMSYRES